MSIKGKKKNIPFGIIHINVGSNNVIVTFTDMQGNKVSGSSAGTIFKNNKKSTAYAGQLCCDALIEKIVAENNVKTVDVLVKGIGSQRESSLRSVLSNLNVRSIKDITPIPHNGPRPKKRRRV